VLHIAGRIAGTADVLAGECYQLTMPRRWSRTDISRAVEGASLGGVKVGGICITAEGHLLVFDEKMRTIPEVGMHPEPVAARDWRSEQPLYRSDPHQAKDHAALAQE
jgi:hypothetical protein